MKRPQEAQKRLESGRLAAKSAQNGACGARRAGIEHGLRCGGAALQAPWRADAEASSHEHPQVEGGNVNQHPLVLLPVPPTALWLAHADLAGRHEQRLLSARSDTCLTPSPSSLEGIAVSLNLTPSPSRPSPVHGLVSSGGTAAKAPQRAGVEDPQAPPRRRVAQAPWAAPAVSSAWTSSGKWWRIRSHCSSLSFTCIMPKGTQFHGAGNRWPFSEFAEPWLRTASQPLERGTAVPPPSPHRARP